jgi:hypothetical protein
VAAVIRYENFSFASAPRTASTWFSAACKEAGLEEKSGNVFSKHEPDPDPGMYKVSIVRHPARWLQSVYYSIGGGLIGSHEFDSISILARNAVDITDFFRKYLESDHTVAAVFDGYQPNSVMRVEDMPWAAIELLESFGVKEEDLLPLRDFTPINATKVLAFPEKKFPAIDKKLRRAVFEKERDFCERCEYW